ncbi:hypothetical protein A3C37_02600 [Candidatus Peribacteria bacterium RIFCSPHIGHO2_02_FULL_53_20]|nr:MAG: hypothetical protein A3C37_02600 [Candidatus Peribacteria bacterium RIFCSPHIGHO2_02_FULL_53_20]OGJ66728.1 MAG: hypothetical protein A3B61_02635 [Candidatus Peribacteria bacterium RIFCSPLOWO2_01_FULL_53_10]
MLTELSFTVDDDLEQIERLNRAAAEVLERELQTSEELFSRLDDHDFPIQGGLNNVAALLFSPGGIVMQNVVDLAGMTPATKTPEAFHAAAESIVQSPTPGIVTRKPELEQRLLQRLSEELHFREEAIAVTPQVQQQCPPLESMLLPPLVGNAALDAARSSSQREVAEYVDHLLVVTIRLIVVQEGARTTFYKIICMSR